ncbi:uncharacterized protein LOC120359971 [Solenopsis invicta]|uniref:uncharacterized protein LOC120359971 n=1 Tax=Solenopsis invicta TaxID=13686 RepID=UPI00193E7299|nr:uncharacterized protein LOC120359971 [Solenopsis invicta]
MLFTCLMQSVMAYEVEIWGWTEIEKLEKIMMDYVRWMFRLDLCTPRYIISRELLMDKLRVGWGIRARRYENRIKVGRNSWSVGKIVKECWKEKEQNNWSDIYGIEREKYYNRNGWGTEAKEVKEDVGDDLEKDLIDRERDIQRQWENKNINAPRYNRRYKKIGLDVKLPNYLKSRNVEDLNRGEKIRAKIKVRCGNLEQTNKYWLEERQRLCIFCEEDWDCLEHYVKDCVKTSVWFADLGADKDRVVEQICEEDTDRRKGEILKKLWKERERELKRRKEASDERGKNKNNITEIVE